MGREVFVGREVLVGSEVMVVVPVLRSWINPLSGLN